MAASKIRVLLVDDSAIVTTLWKRALAGAIDIEVVGVARNGREALALISSLKPSVICTDLHMPIMDGLALTREIMARTPLPILMISASVEEGTLNTFKAIEAGALDVLLKPRIQNEAEFSRMALELENKIRILSGVMVFRQKQVTHSALSSSEFHQPFACSQAQGSVSGGPLPNGKLPVKILVIGASTGGPQVLKIILDKLPADFPVAIVCIQHISLGFLVGLVNWLASTCRLLVKIVQAGDFPKPGGVYFPQEEQNLAFDSQGRFDVRAPDAPNPRPEESRHIPSIDITMKSAAECFGDGALGVLLTGMGSDGAKGLQAIARKGGITIAQDEKSCTVFGMPKQAIELGAAKFILPPEKIANFLGSLKQ